MAQSNADPSGAGRNTCIQKITFKFQYFEIEKMF